MSVHPRDPNTSQDSQIGRELKSGPINDTMNEPSRRHKIRKLCFYI